MQRRRGDQAVREGGGAGDCVRDALAAISAAGVSSTRVEARGEHARWIRAALGAARGGAMMPVSIMLVGMFGN